MKFQLARLNGVEEENFVMVILDFNNIKLLWLFYGKIHHHFYNLLFIIKKKYIKYNFFRLKKKESFISSFCISRLLFYW